MVQFAANDAKSNLPLLGGEKFVGERFCSRITFCSYGFVEGFFLLSTMGFNMRGRCFTFSPIEVSNQIYDIGSFEDKI